MHEQHVFAIVPVEACADQRLTGNELRVLIASLSFRNRDTTLCHPPCKAVADMTGLTEYQVLQATASLVRFGWLEREAGYES